MTVTIENVTTNIDKADDQFAELVVADVRDRISDEDKAYLRQPENLARFNAELIKLLRSFDMQLSRQKIRSLEERNRMVREGTMSEYPEKHLEVLQWRYAILKLRRHAEDRMHEVKALRRATLTISQSSAELVATIARMACAIERHREVSVDEHSTEEDFENIDEELWAILEDANVIMAKAQLGTVDAVS